MPSDIPHLKDPDEFFPNPRLNTIAEDMQLSREEIIAMGVRETIRTEFIAELDHQTVGAEESQ